MNRESVRLSWIQDRYTAMVLNPLCSRKSEVGNWAVQQFKLFLKSSVRLLRRIRGREKDCYGS